MLFVQGFASSLVRPTAFDVDTPVLPEGATITDIDVMKAPYNPVDGVRVGRTRDILVI